ncbi:MAG TPA: hypothetical protein VIN59_02790 [Alphaproteobacteria bacterium]
MMKSDIKISEKMIAASKGLLTVKDGVVQITPPKYPVQLSLKL